MQLKCSVICFYNAIAPVSSSTRIHGPQAFFLKAFGTMGVTEQKQSGLLLQCGINGAKIHIFNLIDVSVGHEDPDRIQGNGKRMGRQVSIVAVSGYIGHGQLGELFLQLPEIPDAVSQMEHMIGIFFDNGPFHWDDFSVGIRKDQNFHRHGTFFTRGHTMKVRKGSGMDMNQDVQQGIKKLLGSPEGRELIRVLNQDGGKTLQEAAGAMKAGDEQRMMDTVAPLLKSPQVLKLMAQLERSLKDG